MKSISNLFLVVVFIVSTPLFSQIKPLKFALKFDFNKASFLDKEQTTATKVNNELYLSLDKYLDSVAKSKSMCMDYSNKNISKNANILYWVRFYKGDYYFNERDGKPFKEYSNVPILQCYLIDNLVKDTIAIWQLPIVKFRETPDKDSINQILENELPFTRERIISATDIIFTNYFSPCEYIADYKAQKKHNKALVFMLYKTVSNNSQNSTLIDNIINNQFITLQINDEKYKNIDKRFIFYPFNKQTKKIKSDITIKLHLLEDKNGNYELKGEFKGKNVNFRGRDGLEMQRSITFNKKRLSNGDYTELLYKLNDFMYRLYVRNILF